MKTKLSVKIGAGFAIILLLTVIVGLSGFISLGNVIHETDFYRSLDKVKNEFVQAEGKNFQYLLLNHNEGRKEQAEKAVQVESHLKAGLKEIEQIFSESSLDPEIEGLLGKIKTDQKRESSVREGV